VEETKWSKNKEDLNMEQKIVEVKMKVKMPLMKYIRHEIKRIAEKNEKDMTFGEKVKFVTFAIIWVAYRKIKTTDWDKFGDDLSMFLCGASAPFWIWAIASYFNVIANNISSPELIWEYNFFVVMLNIFG
jgi:hypothetical protein